MTALQIVIGYIDELTFASGIRPIFVKLLRNAIFVEWIA
jgi:hypothetical protein